MEETVGQLLSTGNWENNNVNWKKLGDNYCQLEETGGLEETIGDVVKKKSWPWHLRRKITASICSPCYHNTYVCTKKLYMHVQR